MGVLEAGHRVEFPFYLEFAGWQIHPHVVFEVLAYALGTQTFLWLRRRGDPLAMPTRVSIIVAAAVGAVVGAKVLFWLTDPAGLWANRSDLAAWWGGKTIVGALVGGHLAVEWQKRRLGVTTRTGDLFAIPLALAIVVGRTGCFMTGLADRTHGTATSLPWGVDFGDGIARHPTQIYEQVFLVGLLAYLAWRSRTPYPRGHLWKVFLGGYMGWRLAVGFIQPMVPLAGLGAIQWAALAVLIFYGAQRVQQLRTGAMTHA